jgi:protein-S-isoprenylcysteine O-methyltransferase Ste14
VLAGIGLCLGCAAIVLDIATFALFRKHRTTILPHRGATNLITEGPFAKSRNPIYVGNTLLVSGAGLLFGIAWLIPAAFIAAFAVQKLAIEREERHLESKFGDAWRAYAAKTPRWLFF